MSGLLLEQHKYDNYFEMKLDDLLAKLKGEAIKGWFDLGLFLDRCKEEQDHPHVSRQGSYEDFQEELIHGGIALLTFHYMVDGVTVEAEKYASLLRRNIPGVPIHYIAGKIQSKSVPFIQADDRQKVIPELAGFDDWELYQDFYFNKLDRGSHTYNELIQKLWQQTLVIIEKLGRYIEEEGIKLFFVINVCSNPGNVAFALALVLLSEFLKIPVINNNHDFYWEGGKNKIEREKEGSKQGPRDFFFTNDHLGEFFSIIELLFPWQARHWIQVNINSGQSENLIRLKGHNPVNVMEIGTAVNTRQFTKNDKRKNINAFLQLEKMLSRYQAKLVSYSPEDVLERGLVEEHAPRPILIGAGTQAVSRFITENIILLQPTRIIARKRIETSFDLLLKMFHEDEMLERFRKTAHLKMTLLITGPIATGQHAYYKKLVAKFGTLLNEAAPDLRGRVYLALLFGELDRVSFKERFSIPAGIADLYNISSLVLLPSKTEGRGLPIIEATACGTPIFCRRYQPETVYSAVIGEHLEERNRLRVLEFQGKRITGNMVKKISDRIFFPHRFTEDIRHNQRVVHTRYSLDALSENILQILHRLFDQLKPHEETQRIVRESLEDYNEMVNQSNEDLEALLDTRNRQYLAGYSKLSYMFMLKSLIDPSYFRVEQQVIRGMAFHFSRTIIHNDPNSGHVPGKVIHRFYNAVDALFALREGEHAVQHDHAMSYRHRNRNHFPYQDFTFQELTGLINLLYIGIVQASPMNKVELSPPFFTDWNLALLQLTGSSFLAIDDRKLLIERLKKNLPIAYFPGAYIMYELEFFALQSIRARMRLPLEEMLTREMLQNEAVRVQPIYIFAQEKNLGKQLNKKEITDYIVHGVSKELRLLYEFKLIRIIRTQQVCVGIHFPQLGSKALNALRKIRDQKGYILTNRSNAAMMTDMVDMDRFHIGKVPNEFTAHMMGIPLQSGYIQFVPAGVRATLSYPAPIQTAKDFEKALKSDLYRRLVRKLGERTVLSTLREDAAHHGSPVKHVLEQLENGSKPQGPVSYSYLSGTYADRLPYHGVIAVLNYKKTDWDFAAVSAKGRPRTVLQFAKEFHKQKGYIANIAWNGGYNLNSELVGKLGLPESYVGVPLGLLISGGRLISPPLFNKPALLVYKDGSIRIKRVNGSMGMSVVWKNKTITLHNEAYNRSGSHAGSAYFDLLYGQQEIEGNGRIVVRISGQKVKEIVETRKGERIALIPAGITLALEPKELPRGAKAGDVLEISMDEFKEVEHAVEAGPLLLEGGKPSIDMETEGWKTRYSILTQAARLDYKDMRGPKIAVGINARRDLAVLAINGRIRESVGATHQEMAEILQQHGMETAMGFDPGGSSTLVVDGNALNISPYNSAYDNDVYALPPEPRAVSSAIIGFIKSNGT
jgi:glycosyltransferase involved in cell wall biosynthesis